MKNYIKFSELTPEEQIEYKEYEFCGKVNFDAVKMFLDEWKNDLTELKHTIESGEDYVSVYDIERTKEQFSKDAGEIYKLEKLLIKYYHL